MKTVILTIGLLLMLYPSSPELRAQTGPVMKDGLALYRVGEGQPVLLMPYPHASAYHPMNESPLVPILNDLGFSVLTFDPPGIYHSTREPDVTLEEMLNCANELLDHFGVCDSVMVVGHSQSAFCSIALAVECPERVKSMVLIGAISGWPMVRKTSIHKQFGFFTRERWRMMYWGTRKMLNRSNLLIHKKLDQLVEESTYYDTSHVYRIPVDKSDRKRPEPVRAQWMVNLRKYNYDYSSRLAEIKVPVLICAGTHDPLTPVEANMELHNGIEHSVIELFEFSGHSPFVEEKRRFAEILDGWTADFGHKESHQRTRDTDRTKAEP